MIYAEVEPIHKLFREFNALQKLMQPSVFLVERLFTKYDLFKTRSNFVYTQVLHTPNFCYKQSESIKL